MEPPVMDVLCTTLVLNIGITCRSIESMYIQFEWSLMIFFYNLQYFYNYSFTISRVDDSW